MREVETWEVGRERGEGRGRGRGGGRGGGGRGEKERGGEGEGSENVTSQEIEIQEFTEPNYIVNQVRGQVDNIII